MGTRRGRRVARRSWSAPPLRRPRPGCTTKFTTYSTVKAGKTGSKAGAVECLLHQAGYATSQNRSFSTADAKKLAAFQGEHGLTATGRTNGATWAALIAQGSTPTLRARRHGLERAPPAAGAAGARPHRAAGHHALRRPHARGGKGPAGERGLAVTGHDAAAEWAALQAGGQATAHVGRRQPRPAGPRRPRPRARRRWPSPRSSSARSTSTAPPAPTTWDCSGLTMKAWARGRRHAAAQLRGPVQDRQEGQEGRPAARATSSSSTPVRRTSASTPATARSSTRRSRARRSPTSRSSTCRGRAPAAPAERVRLRPTGHGDDPPASGRVAAVSTPTRPPSRPTTPSGRAASPTSTRWSAMVRELAEYERAADQVRLTPDQLHRAVFAGAAPGGEPAAYLLVAEEGDETRRLRAVVPELLHLGGRPRDLPRGPLRPARPPRQRRRTRAADRARPDRRPSAATPASSGRC